MAKHKDHGSKSWDDQILRARVVAGRAHDVALERTTRHVGPTEWMAETWARDMEHKRENAPLKMSKPSRKGGIGSRGGGTAGGSEE